MCKYLFSSTSCCNIHPVVHEVFFAGVTYKQVNTCPISSPGTHDASVTIAAAVKLESCRKTAVTVQESTASHTEAGLKNNRQQSCATDIPWCNKTTWAELNSDNKKSNQWERFTSPTPLTDYFMDGSKQNCDSFESRSISALVLACVLCATLTPRLFKLRRSIRQTAQVRGNVAPWHTADTKKGTARLGESHNQSNYQT